MPTGVHSVALPSVLQVVCCRYLRVKSWKIQLAEKWLVFQDLKEQLRQTKAEMDGLAKELHLEKDRHTADRGKLGPQRRRQAKPNTTAVS